MKKLMVALFVLFTTQVVMAAATSMTKIKNIYVYEDYIVMKMATKHSNSYNCTSPKADEFLYLATNTDGGKKMYSALLTAYAIGKSVRIGYSLCAKWGSTVTIPKVYGITF